ncbi:tetratricopeptide repeat protein [Allomuricauda taeanensis]|uniref:tetratricopeptide repeat protein n=1 Tax=Flagellimonas taeanensis TaxID=1005926 RepID=UPI002E7BF2B1|nr:tetratricopeptide repeat protein [Allomuricauda taeanensis]MEE1964571.1 tetratricopeptide repeat protein [Allomuricauda taeanensis]
MLSINFLGRAQLVKQQIESKKALLALHTSVDTSTVDLWNDLGELYMHLNLEKAMVYVDSAAYLSKKLAYNRGMVRVMNTLGSGLALEGDFLLALHFSRMAYEASTSMNDKEGSAKALLNIAKVLCNAGQLELAYETCMDALNELETVDREVGKARIFIQLGKVLIAQGKFDDARKQLMEALEIVKKKGAAHEQALVNSYFGRLYMEEGNLELASYHIQESMLQEAKIYDVGITLDNLMLLGEVSDLKHDSRAAELYLKTALKTADASGYFHHKLRIVRQFLKLEDVDGLSHKKEYYLEQYGVLMDSLQWKRDNSNTPELGLDLLQGMDFHEGKRSTGSTKNMPILMIGIGVLVLMCVVFMIYGYCRKNRKRIYRELELIQARNEFSRQQWKRSSEDKRMLVEELELRNKELTSHALNLAQKNEMLKGMERLLVKMREATSTNQKDLMKEFERMIHQLVSSDKEWEDFKMSFERIHKDFYSKLTQLHPDISSSDLRICALIRLNLNIKESANMMGISPNSVKAARYRLRKKFDLQPDQEILSYLIAVENDNVGLA